MAVLADLGLEDPSMQRKVVLATFERVQTLRNLEDKILVARAHCIGNIEILQNLRSIKSISARLADMLDIEKTRHQTYSESLGALRNRVRNTTDLVQSNSLSSPMKAYLLTAMTRSVIPLTSITKWRLAGSAKI